MGGGLILAEEIRELIAYALIWQYMNHLIAWDDNWEIIVDEWQILHDIFMQVDACRHSIVLSLINTYATNNLWFVLLWLYHKSFGNVISPIYSKYSIWLRRSAEQASAGDIAIFHKYCWYVCVFACLVAIILSTVVGSTISLQSLKPIYIVIKLYIYMCVCLCVYSCERFR